VLEANLTISAQEEDTPRTEVLQTTDIMTAIKHSADKEMA
jgi:hypothetical protein